MYFFSCAQLSNECLQVATKKIESEKKNVYWLQSDPPAANSMYSYFNEPPYADRWIDLSL